MIGHQHLTATVLCLALFVGAAPGQAQSPERSRSELIETLRQMEEGSSPEVREDGVYAWRLTGEAIITDGDTIRIDDTRIRLHDFGWRAVGMASRAASEARTTVMTSGADGLWQGKFIAPSAWRRGGWPTCENRENL